jgi:hypothetical protein
MYNPQNQCYYEPDCYRFDAYCLPSRVYPTTMEDYLSLFIGMNLLPLASLSLRGLGSSTLILTRMPHDRELS